MKNEKIRITLYSTDLKFADLMKQTGRKVQSYHQGPGCFLYACDINSLKLFELLDLIKKHDIIAFQN